MNITDKDRYILTEDKKYFWTPRYSNIHYLRYDPKWPKAFQKMMKNNGYSTISWIIFYTNEEDDFWKIVESVPIGVVSIFSDDDGYYIKPKQCWSFTVAHQDEEILTLKFLSDKSEEDIGVCATNIIAHHKTTHGF